MRVKTWVEVRIWFRLESGDVLRQWCPHKDRHAKCVSERPTCFIRCGVRRHTPGAGLATFGHHDRKLVHRVWFEAGDSVAERCRVCRLDTQ